MSRYSAISPAGNTDAVLRALAGVWAARTETEVCEKVLQWAKARDALPDVVQRLLEDERATMSRPAGHPIPALQQTAAEGTLKDVNFLSDPTQRVTVSMVAFHQIPSDSPLRQQALQSVLKHLDSMSDPSHRVKAAEFVFDHAPPRTDLRKEATSKLALLTGNSPTRLQTAARRLRQHFIGL